MIRVFKGLTYQDIPTFLPKVLDLLPSFKVNERILIKPNLCTKNKHACTDKSIVETVCSLVKNITDDWWIVESNVFKGTPKEIAEYVNYPEWIIERIVNLSDDWTFLDKNPFKLINLPKLKAHDFLRYTCARKNLFGFVPKPELRLKAHSEGLLETIQVLNELYPSHLVIVDAITIMEGKGSPLRGKLKELGWIIIGNSAEEVDEWVERNIIDEGLLEYDSNKFSEWMMRQAGKMELTRKIYSFLEGLR